MQLSVANISKPAWWTFLGGPAILMADKQGGMAMTLGERIYKLRTDKELSQGELANALEVSRQSISKWETNGSVPELDKLIKLSEIFDISLDELVTGKKEKQESQTTRQKELESTPPRPQEPQIIYVEKTIRSSFSTAQILGVILIFCSLAAFILWACVGDKLNITEACVLCLPISVWGILCLVVRHPLIWSCWCGSVIWWIYVFVLSGRWEEATLFLIIGSLLVIVSLAYTIYLSIKKTIHIPALVWVLLMVVLLFCAWLLAVNLTPPSMGVVEYATPVIPIPDSSVGIE